MKKQLFSFSLAFAFALFGDVNAQITPKFLGRFSTGIYNNTAAEISAYHAKSKRMFVTNGADSSIKVVDISNPASPSLVQSISIKPYGIDLTSVFQQIST